MTTEVRRRSRPRTRRCRRSRSPRGGAVAPPTRRTGRRVADAVSAPTQPASGHTSCEVAWPGPGVAGDRPGFLPAVRPASRTSVAVASLATAQPFAAAVQVAPVCEAPGSPPVSPVVRAVQPGRRRTARRPTTAPAWPARPLPASRPARRPPSPPSAASAAFAASVAAFFCSAVAPGAPRSAPLLRRPAPPARPGRPAAGGVAVLCSATMSATTWPAPAVESSCAWHPAWSPHSSRWWWRRPAGGPRAPFAPFTAVGPSLPAADVPAVPAARGAAGAVQDGRRHRPARRARHRRAAGVRRGARRRRRGRAVAGWSWPGACASSSPAGRLVVRRRWCRR